MKEPSRDQLAKFAILCACFVVGLALSYFTVPEPAGPRPESLGQKVEAETKSNSTPRGPAQLSAGQRPVAPYQGRPTPQAGATPVALNFQSKVDLKLSRDFELSLEYRAAPLSRFRATLGAREAMVNGFIIYKLPQELALKEDAMAFEENSFPVVRDPNSGLIGLITGRIIVKLRDQSFDVESFIGGEKIYEAGHLGVSYIKLAPFSNLEEAYLALKERPEVVRVDLEILQGGVVLK